MRKVVLLSLLIVIVSTAARAQNADNGEDVYKKCRACHQVGESARSAVGPQLNGIIGRKAGTVEGFTYSDANKGSGVTWDKPTFLTYIKDPRAAMPGNKMAFAGIKDEQDALDLFAYLEQFGVDGKKK